MPVRLALVSATVVRVGVESSHTIRDGYVYHQTFIHRLIESLYPKQACYLISYSSTSTCSTYQNRLRELSFLHTFILPRTLHGEVLPAGCQKAVHQHDCHSMFKLRTQLTFSI